MIRSESLPTGTVTFVFTDVESSSQRWETHREAMKEAVARHDLLMRAVIEQQRGYVFKTVGDSFCAAFHTPLEAVRAAIDAQSALAKEDFSAVEGLRVRIGIHTGYADERDGDYFGPPVNRVARLMSIGHGGQVLLSAATRELVYHDLPASTSLVDLGPHRFKDLTHAEQVWQLTAPGLPNDFPPLRSLDTLPNNLPIQPTSFRGREQDLEQVKSLLDEHTLLTVFGAGGVGKTRLAVQAGADLLDRYPDGVWIAELASVTDPALVSSVIAKVLGMSQPETRGVDEPLSQWLKRKQLLLIVDNCEHLLEAVAPLADAICHSCPNVRILATSRQALGIGGEALYRLPSLAVPEASSTLRAEDAVQYGAIALFVDRARFADMRFNLSDDNAPLVAEICRRLDGIPLAIELAAARVNVLSIPNLAKRLHERFRLLTGGSRTALPRQKTLSALIDWSYDLLSAQERTLFSRLATFAGTFTLDAAAFVCAGDGIDETNILDLTTSLVDKSLAVADTSRTQERYRLLESTREYGLEKLTGSGEHERLMHRYAEYFVGVAQEADRKLDTMPLGEWLARLDPDVENFRAVLEWALDKAREAALAGALAGALEMFWWHGGLEAEGRRWSGAALAQLDEGAHPEVEARLRRALALLTSRLLFS
jgi:predicted ATPase/class 3 adenylate cyclase